MRFKLFIALFFTFGLSRYGMAQNHIFVQLHSGEILYYKLADHPSITYTSTELNITAGTDAHKSIPIGNVKSVQYTHPKNISIADGIQTGLTAVYTASGQYISMIKEFEDINKLHLPFGVYLLHSADSSTKVLLP